MSTVEAALKARPQDHRRQGRQLSTSGGMIWARSVYGDGEEWLMSWSASESGVHIELLRRIR